MSKSRQLPSQRVTASVPPVLAVLFLAGCTTYAVRTIPPARVYVEAVRNADVPRERYSYTIVSGLPTDSDEATYFALAAEHVRTALSSKGMYEVPEGLPPDMVIEIDFGLEAPLIAVGDSYNIGWTGDDATALRVDEIVYDKYLRITARETAAEAGRRPPRELWSIYVTNRDTETNLPRYILLMVSAAMDMIGERTVTRKTLVLTVKDERVVFVEKGM